MDPKRLTILCLLALFSMLGAAPLAEAADPISKTPLPSIDQQNRRFNSWRYQPAPPSIYDPLRDEVTHRESVLQPPMRLEGGEAAYHGNRLSRWSYIGPTGQGGYYEDLSRYQKSMRLDPRNYRYRFR